MNLNNALTIRDDLEKEKELFLLDELILNAEKTIDVIDYNDEEISKIDDLIFIAKRIAGRLNAGMNIDNVTDNNRFEIGYLVSNDRVRNHIDDIHREIVTIGATEKINYLLSLQTVETTKLVKENVKSYMKKIYNVNHDFDFDTFGSKLVTEIYHSHFNKGGFVRKDSKNNKWNVDAA